MKNLPMEEKLSKYIQAINEIAKSKIANYKAESMMNDHPFYDEYKFKLDAIEEFMNDAKLSNWADGLTRLTDEH